MRKAILMAPLFVALLALMFAAPAKAVTVTVETCDPSEPHLPRDTFFPGDTLCVHIYSTDDAEGGIVLLDPSEDPIPITGRPLTLTGGEDHYEYYTLPYDIPLGTWYVLVELEGGAVIYDFFTVIEFFIIPELPLGTLMAIVACFAAVITQPKIKSVKAIR